MTISVAERRALLDVLARIARDAARIVLDVYATDFVVAYKGANDPVTDADRQANAFVCRELERAYPGVPIVAEESAVPDRVANARELFFVDPLDGTRDFVDKNGEFCTMIGFAEAGRATAGVIIAPVLGYAVAGGEGVTAYELDERRTELRVSTVQSVHDARFVVTRSRRNAQLDALLHRIGPAAVEPCGSAGIKGLRVAYGTADAYLQPGRAGSRWDACASEAIVRAAGGELTNARLEPIDYASGEIINSRGVLATNGLLHTSLRSFLAE